MERINNKYVELKYNKTLHALHVTFNGFIPHKEFVAILEHEYKMVEAYKLKKCLIDLRSMQVYDRGNEDYIKNTWFPKMFNLGLQYIAFVVPKSVLANMSMQKAHTDVSVRVISVEHFDSISNASAWLQSH